MLNDVFRRTWGERAGPTPDTEYWTDVISAVRARPPRRCCSSPRRTGISSGSSSNSASTTATTSGSTTGCSTTTPAGPRPPARRCRLPAAPAPLHREPRRAAGGERARAGAPRAAAVVIATLPGATLWHEGQFEGWTVHVPVLLGRRPFEADDGRAPRLPPPPDRGAHQIRHGDVGAVRGTGWPTTRAAINCSPGRGRTTNARALVVVNYADEPARR